MVEILTRERNRVNSPPGEWKEVFLQALARAPIVSVAAAMAGVSLRHAIDERHTDAAFAQRWEDALEQGVDEIEAAAYLGAVFGRKKPVFHRGKQVDWISNDSPATRSMFLKARRPQVFGEKEKPKTAKTTVLTLDEFEKRVEAVLAASPEYYRHFINQQKQP